MEIQTDIAKTFTKDILHGIRLKCLHIISTLYCARPDAKQSVFR